MPLLRPSQVWPSVQLLLLVYRLLVCIVHPRGFVSITKQLGENIRRLRLLREWSQEDLAAASDLHRTYISQVERGQRNPTLFVLVQISNALQVTPSELLRGVDAQKNPRI